MKCRFAVRAPAAVALILHAAALVAASTISAAPARNKTEATTTVSELMFHRATYEGKVTDDEARFVAAIDVESLIKQEVAQSLFEGELALFPPKLPPALRIERDGDHYRLLVSKPGRYQFNVEFVAKV